MKKLLVLLLTICAMMALFSVGVLAADAPGADVNLRISAQIKNGELAHINDHTSFESGWKEALQLATDKKALKENGYVLIVVDIYNDWVADDGKFSKDGGTGFKWDTLYIPEGTKLVLNLNGNTIERGLDEYEYNGEVMYVDENAEIVINGGANASDTTKTGTITGGFSCNGAGGIHINDGAKVTLNNVNVTGNVADDDDGGGIALYDGATLIMNGGSLTNNIIDNTAIIGFFNQWFGNLSNGGAIYSNDSTVILNNVTIKDNKTQSSGTHGAAIYAKNSTVTLDGCTVTGNGLYDSKNDFEGAKSVLYSNRSNVIIKNSTFTNNGANLIYDGYWISSLIGFRGGNLSIDSSTFTGNLAGIVLDLPSCSFNVSNSTFNDNKSCVIYGSGDSDADNYFSACTFNNNFDSNKMLDSFSFTNSKKTITFYDCDFGNSTFNHRSWANYKSSSQMAVASIFGDGSISMVVSMLALVASVVAIVITVGYNKKKSADSAEKTETSEE